jgi:hypothetical protein
VSSRHLSTPADVDKPRPDGTKRGLANLIRRRQNDRPHGVFKDAQGTLADINYAM